MLSAYTILFTAWPTEHCPNGQNSFLSQELLIQRWGKIHLKESSQGKHLCSHQSGQESEYGQHSQILLSASSQLQILPFF